MIYCRKHPRFHSSHSCMLTSYDLLDRRHYSCWSPTLPPEYALVLLGLSSHLSLHMADIPSRRSLQHCAEPAGSYVTFTSCNTYLAQRPSLNKCPSHEPCSESSNDLVGEQGDALLWLPVQPLDSGPRLRSALELRYVKVQLRPPNPAAREYLSLKLSIKGFAPLVQAVCW